MKAMPLYFKKIDNWLYSFLEKRNCLILICISKYSCAY